MQSAPPPILESHELYSMTLEYRKECGKDSVLKSLTAIPNDSLDTGGIECEHTLRLESGSEIVRGRTEWRPKHGNNFGNVGHIHAENA